MDASTQNNALTETYGNLELPAGTPERPLVTFALFAYNQEKYIREAVEGAFSQNYSPLEIILSDDCSGDRTFEIIREMAQGYAGAHRLRLNRNDRNLRLAAHVNRALALSQGEIIVLAAGDDVSLPSRVADTVAAFARHLDAMAVSFSDIRIGDSGDHLDNSTPLEPEKIIDLKTFLATGPRAQSRLGLNGASRAIRRVVYMQFGDLLPDCPAEDSPYLLRVLYMGTLKVCGNPGIRYRVHETQLSSARSIAGMDPDLFAAQYLRDMKRALAEHLLSPSKYLEVMAFISEIKIAYQMRRLIYTNQVPDRHILKCVLQSPHYALREKLGLCKRFLLRQRVG